jgi:transposase-like protein
VLCPICSTRARRFGRNRNGSQRWHCPACNRTFTAGDGCDNRRVPEERAVFCLRMLLEGSSIRSTERLTGTHRDMIIDAMVAAGERCRRLLEAAISGIAVANI